MRSCFVYQLECRRKHTHIFWFNSFCYSLVLSRRKKRQTQRARVRMKEGKPNFDSIRSVRHVSIRVFNILRNQWSPFVFWFSFLPNSEEKIETREKNLPKMCWTWHTHISGKSNDQHENETQTVTWKRGMLNRQPVFALLLFQSDVYSFMSIFPHEFVIFFCTFS